MTGPLWGDLIRMLILYKYGGIYVDVDVAFLRPMEPFFVSPFCVTVISQFSICKYSQELVSTQKFNFFLRCCKYWSFFLIRKTNLHTRGQRKARWTRRYSDWKPTARPYRHYSTILLAEERIFIRSNCSTLSLRGNYPWWCILPRILIPRGLLLKERVEWNTYRLISTYIIDYFPIFNIQGKKCQFSLIIILIRFHFAPEVVLIINNFY